MSENDFEDVNQTFLKNQEQYQQVTSYIDEANELGTAKSALSSALDNMLCQIEPMISSFPSGWGIYCSCPDSM
ncbi:MAG: hypothetical protein NC180_12020 [Muribaculaceae bacterium]|nr:hypothetical protein [Roseburia sp.]MCM1432204.1 hypothetical protein [Muribaculaceae bacterium]MCM1493929.1 hypothetical protein [Muribaculaceae bacterium]